MKRFYIALLLLLPLSVLAQQPSPGGVKGAAAWFCTRAGGLYDQVSQKSLMAQKNTSTLNGNPAMYLGSRDSLPSITLSTPNYLTFIAVYSQADTLEHPLFSLHEGNTTPLLVTAARLADLQQRSYLNYPVRNQHGIYLYTQRQINDSLNIQPLLLRIARQPQDKLPITTYQGAMPEAVLYNRILTLSERQRIQSYLSLKYGVSLEQEPFPNSYYSASGDELWNATRLSAYSNRITGIGRDDLSGLLQPQSTNIAEPDLPMIAVQNKETLANNTFLLWGDNKQALRMNKQQGMPNRLERQWLSQAVGSMASVATSIQMSTVRFEQLLEKGNTYWLAIDHSASGNYPITQAVYHKCSTCQNSTITFSGLYWATPNAVFTVVQAPDFFVRSELKQPYCQSGQDGRLTIECVGGKSPYKIVLEKDGQLVSQLSTPDAISFFSSLKAARYTLSVADAAGKYFRDTLYLSHADGPMLQPQSSFVLQNGSVAIDATSMLPDGSGSYSYRWEHNGKVVGGSPLLQAATSGTYTLTVQTNQGCTSTAQINVSEEPHSLIQDVLLYPNPAVGGRFHIRIRLAQAAPVTVNTFDVKGRLVRQKSLSQAADFHVYEGNETRPGIYIIVVQAAGEKYSLKLIVK